MKTFRPRELKASQSFFAMATISTTYWDYAQQLKKQALDEFESDTNKLYSLYVFPFIVFLSSSFEALLNEQLAVKLVSSPIIVRDHILEVKDAPNRNYSMRNKIIEVAKLYGDSDFESNYADLLNNYDALTELRNSIIHYNIRFSSIYDWPKKLQDVLNRSKIKVIEADWTITFRQREIIDWSESTAIEIIKIFLNYFHIENCDFFGI